MFLPICAAQVFAAEPRPAPKIDTSVTAALDAGPARVTVQLFLPATAAADNQQAIAQAQEQVLAGLAGTQFRLARRATTVPFLTLEIGNDALTRLAAMQGLVARVYLDSRLAPKQTSAPGSAIHQAGMNQ